MRTAPQRKPLYSNNNAPCRGSRGSPRRIPSREQSNAADKSIILTWPRTRRASDLSELRGGKQFFFFFCFVLVFILFFLLILFYFLFFVFVAQKFPPLKVSRLKMDKVQGDNINAAAYGCQCDAQWVESN